MTVLSWRYVHRYTNHGYGTPPISVVHIEEKAYVAVLVPQLDAVLVIDPTGKAQTQSLALPPLPQVETQPNSWMPMWHRNNGERNGSWNLANSTMHSNTVLAWHPALPSVYEINVQTHQMIEMKLDIEDSVLQVHEMNGQVMVRGEKGLYMLHKQGKQVTAEQISPSQLDFPITGCSFNVRPVEGVTQLDHACLFVQLSTVLTS